MARMQVAIAANCRYMTNAPVGSYVHLQRVADGLPSRVAAVHVLRVEARLAQLDGGLAADVEAVGAVHHHRLRFRKLTDPLLQLLGIPPLSALGNILPAQGRCPRTYVDDLDGLARGHQLFHFLDADALDVAEFRLFEVPWPGNLGG